MKTLSVLVDDGWYLFLDCTGICDWISRAVLIGYQWDSTSQQIYGSAWTWIYPASSFSPAKICLRSQEVMPWKLHSFSDTAISAMLKRWDSVFLEGLSRDDQGQTLPGMIAEGWANFTTRDIQHLATLRIEMMFYCGDLNEIQTKNRSHMEIYRYKNSRMLYFSVGSS